MYSINYKIIIFLMGVLLIFNGSIMLLSVLVSFIYQDGITTELISSAFSIILLGTLMSLLTKNHDKQIQKREGYLIVTLGWLLISFSGMLPYYITNVIHDLPSIFFEVISGYTTTGATIISDVESLPKGILFWRSTTHWIGGMGIIVLAIAILPFLGIGGMQLFSAEAPGPSSDKLHPRITDTAKRLWLIYILYTAIETLFLNLAGMSFFDSINHAMSTIATGGFSTKNTSVAFWNDKPLIQYIITFFMILAGSNFVLSYYAFKGKFTKIIGDEEFKLYLSLLFLFTIIISVLIFLNGTQYENYNSFSDYIYSAERAFRQAFFQVVAIITTTGFVVFDYTIVIPLITVGFFGLMFLGGSSGSTSGGMKVVRHLLMIKSGFLELKRALHPNAIIQVRYNRKIVKESISYNIFAFFILYMLSFIIGALGFSFMGVSFENSIGLAAASIGNVGPALGDYGPVNTYISLGVYGKIWASFLMLLGRLELFTVLILFTPYFWKKS
jgi:trk system potassium uptake protein TrkH